MFNYSQTFTITFGDQAENHHGMQMIGEAAAKGLTWKDLRDITCYFNSCYSEIIRLDKFLPSDVNEEATILIIHGGLNEIVDADAFYEEQAQLKKDTKAFMWGRVVNKHARHNLCFGPEGQEADYENGRGTVVPFSDVPLLSKVRDHLERLSPHFNQLVAEGNYYYDLKKCGIGFHGDAERRIVVGIRVGADLPLHFQWYHKNKPVGKRCEISLGHGDIYIMSDKAVGYDWKCSSKYTLRHAAGADKYLYPKEK